MHMNLRVWAVPDEIIITRSAALARPPTPMASTIENRRRGGRFLLPASRAIGAGGGCMVVATANATALAAVSLVGSLAWLSAVGYAVETATENRRRGGRFLLPAQQVIVAGAWSVATASHRLGGGQFGGFFGGWLSAVGYAVE